jgi:superfamily I DNA/RNA helicase
MVPCKRRELANNHHHPLIMTPSNYQIDIFNWIENGVGNAIVNAKAGSGKTTTAIQGITRMSGNVLMLAFNKKIVVELQSRLATMGCPHAAAATFHSEGMKVFLKNKPGAKVFTGKVYNIVQLFTESGPLMKSRSTIMKLVSFAKNSGFGIEGCPSIDDTDAWVNIIKHQDIDIDMDIDIADLIEVCKQVLVLNNRDVKNIDFDDMIYLPLLFDHTFTKYDWVIVDEAQDTNVVRKLMMNKLLGDKGRLLAIGDPGQAIYMFCGAENDSMDIIKRNFNAIELPLSVCYRCGKNIIKEAQKYRPDIEAFEGNPDGVVLNMKYDEFIKQAETLNLNAKDGIVCRNNAPLVSLAFALIRQGIGCRIEGRDIGQNLITLCNKWKRVSNLDVFSEKLHAFFAKEFDKATNAKRAMLEDKLDTMLILIERCQSLGKNDTESLKRLIEDMFTDNGDVKNANVVTLSSIHKAKGLEFENCWALGNNQFIPSKYANTDAAKEQETNLLYISVTRAINKLVLISDIPTRKSDIQED